MLVFTSHDSWLLWWESRSSASDCNSVGPCRLIQPAGRALASTWPRTARVGVMVATALGLSVPCSSTEGLHLPPVAGIVATGAAAPDDLRSQLDSSGGVQVGDALPRAWAVSRCRWCGTHPCPSHGRPTITHSPLHVSAEWSVGIAPSRCFWLISGTSPFAHKGHPSSQSE